MNSNNYPILKILFPLILGILIAFLGSFSFKYSNYLFFIIVFFLLFSAFLFHKLKYKKQFLGSILLQICFVIAGFLSTQHHLLFNNETENKDCFQKNKDWIVTINDMAVEKERTFKFRCKVEGSLQNNPIQENAILYFQKTEKSSNLKIGDQLLIHAKFNPIEKNTNPYSFDFKTYMQRKKIRYTAYISPVNFQVVNTLEHFSVRKMSFQIQHFFIDQFNKAGMDGDEFAIATAILLGNNENLNPELRNSYASAGVSHILCVSGMHVGIIYMILNFLLHSFDINRKSRMVKNIIILSLIWIYANITGLAPSVLRSAMMFSFVSIGDLFNRNCNIYHSLFTSLFVLLCINPLYLFEMGLQLSYLAVFGIALFQRPIVNLWTPKTKLTKYFWELISVSLSAQLATCPISIYYFGQFPNYFLLSNIAVMMLSFIIVISGVVVLVFSFSNIIATFFAQILCFEISKMNIIIRFIEKMPGAVSDYLALSISQVILLYIIILGFYLFLLNKKNIFYWLSIASLLVFSLEMAFYTYEGKKEVSVTVYSIPHRNAINFNYHGNSILVNDFMINKTENDYRFAIYNHERTRKINSQLIEIQKDTIIPDLHFFKKSNCIVFDGKKYFIVLSK
ncbi:MAG: ComEC family competence protein [Bacteroidales bacterium]|jgi:competence protein ComEC|nr:ComEC family competence protein [Bacteroidales bacterium]